jgi:hypothetical protein
VLNANRASADAVAVEEDLASPEPTQTTSPNLWEKLWDAVNFLVELSGGPIDAMKLAEEALKKGKT